MLYIKKITKKYKRAGNEFEAVSNVDLEVKKGEFIHIIGKSGSGKSTFLNIIAGLLTPDIGSIILNSQEYINFDDDKKSQFRNEHIGFIPQQASMLSYLNVIDNIILPYDLYDRDMSVDIYGKAKYILEKLGASHLADSYPSELSGGELRRVMIARAIINDPDILIADEPTSDLDIESTKDVMNMLSKLNDDGMTIIVVTHELDTLKYGKKVYTMDDGKLLFGKHI